MLTISIKIGRTLKVGPVIIKFFERKGNWIRIAIDCPREFLIKRDVQEGTNDQYPDYIEGCETVERGVESFKYGHEKDEP